MDTWTSPDKLIEELYQKMYDALYIYAKSVLHEETLAEEAVQDTFCIACARRNQIFSSSNPKGWLINTLKNVMKNMVRKQVRLNQTILQLLAASKEINDISTPIDWNVEILYEDIAESADFKLLKMVELDNYSMREAAEELGISISACKKRAQRARDNLRKKLLQNE